MAFCVQRGLHRTMLSEQTPLSTVLKDRRHTRSSQNAQGLHSGTDRTGCRKFRRKGGLSHLVRATWSGRTRNVLPSLSCRGAMCPPKLETEVSATSGSFPRGKHSAAWAGQHQIRRDLKPGVENRKKKKRSHIFIYD